MQVYRPVLVPSGRSTLTLIFEALRVTFVIAASLLVRRSITCTAFVVSVAGGVINNCAYAAFDG